MPAKKVRRFKNTKNISFAKKSRVIIQKSPLPVAEEEPQVIIPQTTLVVENVPSQEIVQPPVENILETSQPVPEETQQEPKEMDFLYPDKPNGIKESDSNKKSGSFTKIFLFLLIFILGVVVGGVLMYFYKSSRVTNKKVENQIVAKQPTPTLIPTQIPVDLSQYSISILNGSLAKGGAAKLKTELGVEGFNITAVGNATSSTFKETIIRAKKSVGSPYLLKLQAFLSKKFVLGSMEVLEDSKKTDIVIIIGGKTVTSEISP